MIHILIGKSASGKDTMLHRYIAKGMSPVISYTTRPIRAGEQDGVDYHFVSKTQFEALEKAGAFTETRAYDTLVAGKPDTWYYGSPYLDNADSADYVVILDVKGAKQWIKCYGSDLISIEYIMAEDDVREQRAMNRGSFDQTEWERRLKDDRIKFSREAIRELERVYGKKLLYIHNN